VELAIAEQRPGDKNRIDKTLDEMMKPLQICLKYRGRNPH